MENYRKEIDLIDSKLINLLQQRFELSQKIGEYKKIHHIPVECPQRESDILSRIPDENGFFRTEICGVYRTIFEMSKGMQKR